MKGRIRTRFLIKILYLGEKLGPFVWFLLCSRSIFLCHANNPTNLSSHLQKISQHPMTSFQKPVSPVILLQQSLQVKRRFHKYQGAVLSYLSSIGILSHQHACSQHGHPLDKIFICKAKPSQAKPSQAKPSQAKREAAQELHSEKNE